MRRIILLTLILMCLNVYAITLPALISDNMVLQKHSQVSIWGWSAANETIFINPSWGGKVSAKADKKGEWICTIQTPDAGGPYELQIKGNAESITIRNILIGQVWFCSGQSNMEMPLSGWPPNDPIQNSEYEIENAHYPKIRFFTVRRMASAKPLNDCSGEWHECQPQTAESFSATAYFFGIKLFQELKEPIGLIHSSWGGTPAQSWINKKFLSRFTDFKTILARIDSSQGKIAEYEDWLSAHPRIEIDMTKKDWSDLHFNDDSIMNRSYDDEEWPVMTLPQLWENSELGSFDGVVWFRKNIHIPEQWLGLDLVVKLGPIDDMDATYINGVKIGGYEKTGLWQKNREYLIPAKLITGTDIIIAVRVIDYQGGGGLYGETDQMKLHPVQDADDSISLAGSWKYLPVAEYKNGQFYIFDASTQEYFVRPRLPIEIDSHTPTALYNGMVHPVKPFSIKGVIWYQGESNTNNPVLYDSLFPALIKNWRHIWQQEGLPFYYVQIAPYDYGEDTHSERLRESQLKTLALPNTGMVVTLDIGNPRNIHPANKQDVGKRLALWALAKTYDKSVIFSGPLYKTMKVKGNKVYLSFDYAENGLRAKNSTLDHFQISGTNREFIDAIADIQNNQIVVYHPEIRNPVAVRYAWNNTAEASLFNAEGLPASSFRTDDW